MDGKGRKGKVGENVRRDEADGGDYCARIKWL